MSILVKNLTYIYPKNFVALDDISFEIEKGDFVGILGENGAGKSTLLDILIGFKQPVQGSVVIHDQDILQTKGIVNDYVYMSHDITLNGQLTVTEFLEFASYFYSNYKKEIENDLISYFKINKSAMIATLSTGQQRKLQIVSCLSADTSLILIDEITAVLDPESRIKFFKKLIELNKVKQKTIVLATNIYEDIKNLVNKILFIKDHKVYFKTQIELGELFNA